MCIRDSHKAQRKQYGQPAQLGAGVEREAQREQREVLPLQVFAGQEGKDVYKRQAPACSHCRRPQTS